MNFIKDISLSSKSISWKLKVEISTLFRIETCGDSSLLLIFVDRERDKIEVV
ncbi:hypothetical protein Lalb_Chr03g0039641 [Lupinus albus]|uniref:Uncharacterized protein n=1 Tax=Lupinus albus TaxID=3870 RepID=A0A6A4QWI2_LUPAL|nr:hypothetical protein Lalb_Chr03g0039641 [Lupinus albus]